MNPEVSLGRRIAVYAPGLLIFALAELQLSLNPAFPSPAFLLIFPLLAGLWTPGYDGFVLGLVAGFISDYAAGRGYGPGMLLLMAFGLCGSYLAREGWRQYAVRGGILLVAASLAQALIYSLLAWMIPLRPLEGSLPGLLKLSLSSLPAQVLSTGLGALLVTGYLFLAFRDWKQVRRRHKSGPAAEEALNV